MYLRVGQSLEAHYGLRPYVYVYVYVIRNQAWTGHCAIAMAQAPPSTNTGGAPWPIRIFLIIGLMVTFSVDRQHYR